jgi:hypothetical protein
LFSQTSFKLNCWSATLSHPCLGTVADRPSSWLEQRVRVRCSAVPSVISLLKHVCAWQILRKCTGFCFLRRILLSRQVSNSISIYFHLYTEIIDSYSRIGTLQKYDRSCFPPLFTGSVNYVASYVLVISSNSLELDLIQPLELDAFAAMLNAVSVSRP